MFDLTVTNNFIWGFFYDGGNRIFEPGQMYPFPHTAGDHYITIPAMGDIFIRDLGDTKLKRYTEPRIPWTEKKWGGLVRYRGLDAYFRYEGTGLVSIVIDNVGSIKVHFEQGGMMVNLDDMTVS
jgi:hypothetical protein